VRDALGVRVLPLILLAGALSAGGTAQVRAAELEDEPSSATYLPVDQDAEDVIAQFDQLIAHEEWRKAIEVCQNVLVLPAEGVIEIAQGVYGSPRTLYQKKLREMPVPARLLYQTLYDPEAEKLYKQALRGRDLAAARQLVSQFMNTSFGPRGLDLLATLHFEHGEAQAALAAWEKWTDWMSGDSLPEAERRLAAAKMALAAATTGSRSMFEKALDLFGPKGAVVELGGVKVARSEELKQLGESRWKPAEVRPAAPEAFDYRKCVAGFGTSTWENMSRHYGYYYYSNWSFSYGGQIANGVLYVSTPDGVRAVSTLTGRLVWQRTMMNYETNYYGGLLPIHYYCRLYPMTDDPAKKVLFTSGGIRINAFDAESGKTLWTNTHNSLKSGLRFLQDADLRVAFASPVLCDRRRAYALLQTNRGEAYLLAFDRSTGGLVWGKAVGSSVLGQGYHTAMPAGLLAAGPDIIFCDGQGIIGKCDAGTGEIRWLVPYRRQKSFVGDYRGQKGSLPACVIVRADDAVICMPPDGGELIAVSLADGQVKWRKETMPSSTFLGMLEADHDGGPARLFIRDTLVRCLDAKTGSVLWTWPLPEQEQSAGQGCLTDRYVLTTTAKALYGLDTESGRLINVTPLNRTGTNSLNVVSDGDSVALVSSDGASVFGGKERTRELLADAAARVPQDPWVVSAGARLLENDKKLEEAIDSLARVAALSKSQTAAAVLGAAARGDIVRLYHELYAADWKSGRRIEAFLWLQKALQSPEDAPYECKFGHVTEVRNEAAAPHRVIMASGDSVSGEVTGIESGVVAMTAWGESWRVSARGVREIVLVRNFSTLGSEAPVGPHVVFANGEGWVSGTVGSLRDGVVRLSARFGELQIPLGRIAVIYVGGATAQPPEPTSYVKLTNGDMLHGAIRSFDGAEFTIEIPFCGRHRVKLENVASIGNFRSVPAPARVGDSSGQSRRIYRIGPGIRDVMDVQVEER